MLVEEDKAEENITDVLSEVELLHKQASQTAGGYCRLGHALRGLVGCVDLRLVPSRTLREMFLILVHPFSYL